MSMPCSGNEESESKREIPSKKKSSLRSSKYNVNNICVLCSPIYDTSGIGWSLPVGNVSDIIAFVVEEIYTGILV